ncbi:MAG: two-component regulator propeller domain-containing protein [Verrucomicrobiota bacterium]
MQSAVVKSNMGFVQPHCPELTRCRPARGFWKKLGLLCAGWLVAAHPAPAAPNYIVRAWHAEEGLPQNAVTAVIQSRDGYLWLGTYTGLVRFDGNRFVIFDDNNTPALKNNRITSLYEGYDGTIWIGHETGDMTRLKDGRFEPVTFRASWKELKILDIAEDDLGEIWAMNASGVLARVRDARILEPDMGLISGVISMARHSPGKIWVNRCGTVSELRHGELHPLNFDPPRTNCYAFGICASRDGGLWVEVDNRVRKWVGDGWVEDRGYSSWGTTAIVSFMEMRNGWLAAGTTEQGLFLLPPQGDRLVFNRTNGLSQNWIRDLCEDREGDLWVGTGAGLNMLRRSSWSVVTPPDNWQACAVLSVTAGQDDSVWVGTEGSGVYRCRDGAWSHFDQKDGLRNPFVWSVAEDYQRQVWAGTWGGGIFVRRDSTFEVPGPELNQFRRSATAILPARDGGIWIGTGSGLMHYTSNEVASIGPEQGLTSPDVRSVAESADGKVWFGMYGGGLGCLENGRVRQFFKRDGLASDFVQCLKLETDGTLWIGTFGGGLSRLKNGTFKNVTTDQGLPNNVICHIEDGENGFFWISSYNGIFRVARSELEACADGSLPEVNCLVFGEGDSPPKLECSGGFQPAGCRTRDGRLWFPTSKGLVVLDPSNITTNHLPPAVVIESFRVDGHPVAVNDPGALRIRPGHQRFDFQYTALSFVAPEQVQFRCRLEGVEMGWVDAGSRREMNYTFLAPGSYVFRVTACNNDGIWNEEGVSLAFTVLPFFWQTGWFRAAAAAGLAVGAGGLGWYATRRRMRRKLEKLERQRAIENERTRIAKDIHDDLGSTLTQITMLSDPQRGAVRETPPADNLHQIHTIARDLTQSMDEIVWAINPQHDSLDSLLAYLESFAQEFLETAGVRCRLDVPLQLPALPLTAEARHNLFLAFKESLHNVVKHSGASEVHISATLTDTLFTLSLRDNGRGFQVPDPGDFHGTEPEKDGFGNGLINMRRRLDKIGGHCDIESTPGKGAAITFTVRLPARAAEPKRES